MSTPTPVTQQADPTTPGNTPAPTALGAAVTAATAGTPVAVVTVWLLETYGSAHGKPLVFDSLTATAVGSVGAGILIYVVNVVKGLLAILQERLTR